MVYTSGVPGWRSICRFQVALHHLFADNSRDLIRRFYLTGLFVRFAAIATTRQVDSGVLSSCFLLELSVSARILRRIQSRRDDTPRGPGFPNSVSLLSTDAVRTFSWGTAAIQAFAAGLHGPCGLDERVTAVALATADPTRRHWGLKLQECTGV